VWLPILQKETLAWSNFKPHAEFWKPFSH
jgi:hypothetical protein